MFVSRQAVAIAAFMTVLLQAPAARAVDDKILRSQDLEKCARLPSDRARLDCYQALTRSQPGPADASSSDARQWHMVRTPGPDGESLSMTHTPDTTRSDPDFAGFSIHCGKTGPEYLLIIINPLPPRSRPTVTISGSGKPISLVAMPLPSGAALLLPPETKVLAQGPWRTQTTVDFVISDGNYSLHGAISFHGFSQALSELSAACPGR